MKRLTFTSYPLSFAFSVLIICCQGGEVEKKTPESAVAEPSVAKPSVTEPAFSLPDKSSPEATLRTFFRAIKKGDKDSALSCADSARIREGRHGNDVEKLIGEYKSLDTKIFEYKCLKARCTVRSPTHNMDYEMEKNEKGEWIIISIHP